VNFCKDCKYHVETKDWALTPDFRRGGFRCIADPPSPDPILGKVVFEDGISCEYNRSEKGKCGPEGKLFVASSFDWSVLTFALVALITIASVSFILSMAVSHFLKR
jgi:hypothetical protein